MVALNNELGARRRASAAAQALVAPQNGHTHDGAGSAAAAQQQQAAAAAAAAEEVAGLQVQVQAQAADANACRARAKAAEDEVIIEDPSLQKDSVLVFIFFSPFFYCARVLTREPASRSRRTVEFVLMLYPRSSCHNYNPHHTLPFSFFSSLARRWRGCIAI